MAEQNAEIKKCKFCSKPMKDKEVVCRNCGYNIETNTQDPNFKPGGKSSEAAHATESGKNKFTGILKFVILVALIFALVTYLAKRKSLPVPSFPKKTTSSAASKPQTSKPAVSTSANKQSSEKSILKNVFREPAPEEKRKSGLILEGVFYDPQGKSFATMNGMVVEEGQNVSGVEIIKINNDSVEVSVNGSRKVLKVSQSIPLPH